MTTSCVPSFLLLQPPAPLSPVLSADVSVINSEVTPVSEPSSLHWEQGVRPDESSLRSKELMLHMEFLFGLVLRKGLM